VRLLLVVPFVLQIFWAVGLVGYISYRSGQKAAEDMAKPLMTEIGDRLLKLLRRVGFSLKMFLKKIWFVLFGLVIANCLLWGCQASTPLTVKPAPLKVAFTSFVGNYPAIIAQEKSFFKQQGVDVELIYGDFVQSQQADFSAGKYDGIGLTLGDFIILSANNPNMQAVLVADETNGADVIVAQPDIQTVADLKGKKIGSNLGGFSEVFVTEMLNQFNLTTDDVSLVKFDALEIPERLASNAIQAGHTWEPFLSEAIKKGARPLFTSKQTPGLISDLVAFRNETIRDRPEAIRSFVRGWLQALDFWENNLQAGNEIIAKKLNIPLETISLDGINLTNLQENQRFFKADSSNSIYDFAKIYADFFIRSGNVTRIPDIKSLFNSSFLMIFAQHLAL